MRTLLTLMGLFWLGFLSAQWKDDFSKNLDSLWIGDRSHFQISPDLKLKLNASNAGSSILLHPYRSEDSLIWSFYLKMDFSPSASNRLIVYLVADAPNPDSSNALFIELGENGNNDNWKFYQRVNKLKKLVGEGELTKLSTEPAIVRFRIQKTSDNIWTFYTDYTGTQEFIKESEFQGIQFATNDTSYFGFNCFYTETRKDRFYFDDIEVGPPVKDTLPPKIIQLITTSDSSLEIQFNELLDTNSLFVVDHFLLTDIGNPKTVIQINPSTLGLTFENKFKWEASYTLFYFGISDLYGNKLNSDTINFRALFSLRPAYLDLIITEFMADPVPRVALPEKEFVEIKNRSSISLDLENCSLSDGAIEVYFPKFILEAQSYLILCDIKDTSEFIPYGKVLGMDHFPSINNAGDVLTLRNHNFELLHEVAFDDSWYSMPAKRNGGYSLEMINSADLCSGKKNWRGSEHFSGGTPGKANANEIFLDDVHGPEILEAYPLSEWEIKIVFNEALHHSVTFKKQLFKMLPSRSIATVDLILPDKNELILVLDEPLELGEQYKLVLTNIPDCLAHLNSIESDWFSLPVSPKSGDLVLSEILFNPYSGGNDFIEVCNISNKMISMKQLLVSNAEVNSNWIPIGSDRVIFPGQFIAFTNEPVDLIQKYPVHDSLNIIQSELPAMNDDSGYLKLAFNNKNKLLVLDSVNYNKNWHHPLIHDVQGVSLEKINLKGSSANRNNWQSASAHSGYASPGKLNSQNLVIDTFIRKKPYELSSLIISPNGDSNRDFLAIQFHLLKSGYKTLIEIYDLEGTKQKTLNYLILAPNDLVIWNGEDDAGAKINKGNYIIRMEFIHPDGEVLCFLERVVVDY